MRVRWAVAFAGFLHSLAMISAAQVEVSLAPSKSIYIAGEPVFVVASITNTGTTPVTIVVPSPDSCLSAMTVFIEGLSRSDQPHCADPNTLGCVYDGPGAQLVQVNPGAHYEIQRLLNLIYDLRQAGLYHARVNLHLEYMDQPKVDGKYSFKQRNFENRVVLDIENRPGDLQAAFSPVVADLESSDGTRQHYAQVVLLTLAPRFAEDRILALADRQDLTNLAMPALRKLGTPAAIEELESIAFEPQDSDISREGQREQALEQIKYLHDKSLLPRLYAVMEADRWRSIRWAAASAVARIGHGEAVPAIAKMLANPDPLIAFAAAEAMGDTGSRAAVGVLISAVPNASQGNVLPAIAEALGRLTHRETSSDPDQRAAIYKQWSDWWAIRNTSAPIYDPDTCGVIRQLD